MLKLKSIRSNFYTTTFMMNILHLIHHRYSCIHPSTRRLLFHVLDVYIILHTSIHLMICNIFSYNTLPYNIFIDSVFKQMNVIVINVDSTIILIHNITIYFFFSLAIEKAIRNFAVQNRIKIGHPYSSTIFKF